MALLQSFKQLINKFNIKKKKKKKEGYFIYFPVFENKGYFLIFFKQMSNKIFSHNKGSDIGLSLKVGVLIANPTCFGHILTNAIVC